MMDKCMGVCVARVHVCLRIWMCAYVCVRLWYWYTVQLSKILLVVAFFPPEHDCVQCTHTFEDGLVCIGFLISLGNQQTFIS